MTPVIETERLVLRPFALDDLDNVIALFADPAAMRFSITGVRDRKQTVEWLDYVIRSYEEHGHGFLAAVLKGDGSYVGHAGLLRQQVDDAEEMEIAYWFVRRHWGRGLATEAAIGCRDHAFGEMGRQRLISLIVPDNVPSRRVAEKVGMHVEKETVWKTMPVCVYAIAAPAKAGD